MPISTAGVQTGTDANLSQLSNVTGVDVVDLGNTTYYSLIGVTTVISVTGDLTWNPEIDVVLSDQRTVFRVASGGTLRLGTDLAAQNGYSRQTHPAVGLQGSAAPSHWFGGADAGVNSIIDVESGGSLIVNGFAIKSPSFITYETGSTADIDNLVLIVEAATTETGLGGNAVLPAGRGYIQQLAEADINLRRYTQIGGECFISTALTNSPSIRLENTNSGLAIQNAVAAGQVFENLDLTGLGNGIAGQPVDFILQSHRNKSNGNITIDDGGPTEVAITKAEIQSAIARNPSQGTSLLTRGAEGATATATDSGNRRLGGYARITKTINFKATDLDGADVMGARYFIRDTNNGVRKAINQSAVATANDTRDFVYSGTTNATGVLASDVEVVTGIVNVDNTTTTPRGNPDEGVWSVDRRGKTNTAGEDEFDIYLWHEDFNVVTFVDEPLVGFNTKTLNAIMLPDAAYSNTDFTTKTTIATLDELYDIIKQRKVSSETEVELPTAGTMYVTASGTALEFGTLDVGTNSAQAGVFAVVAGELLFANAATLEGGAKFNGLNGGDFSASTAITVNNIDFEFDNVDLSNVTLGTGITFSGGVITNVPASPAFDLPTSGYVLTFVAGTTTIDASDINFTGTGSIVLNVAGATGSPTVNIAGASTALQTAITAGTVLGNITPNFVVAPVNNSWTIPTTVGGRYAVTQTISGVETQVVAPTDFVAGATITGTISDSTHGVNDTVNLYVKYDSQFTSGSVQYYQASRQAFNFVNTDGTSHVFSEGAAQVANTLISSQGDVSGITLARNATLSTTAKPVIDVTNSTADTSLTVSFAVALQLAARVDNLSTVFDSWYGNRATSTAPIIRYLQGFIVSIDAARIQFASGDVANGFRSQHVINNWRNDATSSTANPLAQSRTGASEILAQIASLALVNPADIAIGINQSDVATGVSSIDNKTDYLVTDGNTTAPGYDRFVGIKPKRAVYSPTTDYTPSS